jgi:hypothetical protein
MSCHSLSCFELVYIHGDVVHLTTIQHCNLVTKKGINAFMTKHSAFEYISLHFSNKVSLDDIVDWQLLARQNIWKLNLNFKYSDFHLRYTS